MSPVNENVYSPSSDIQDNDAEEINDTDLVSESGEDKEAEKDNINDQDETTKQYNQTSKDHETTQEKETVKNHEKEKKSNDIDLFVCKKSIEDIHNDREELGVVYYNTTKRGQYQTENKEMLPQKKDLVLQIDKVCKSKQDVELTKENPVQEATKQAVEDGLIAIEENVFIDMDRDIDANVSVL